MRTTGGWWWPATRATVGRRWPRRPTVRSYSFPHGGHRPAYAFSRHGDRIGGRPAQRSGVRRLASSRIPCLVSDAPSVMASRSCRFSGQDTPLAMLTCVSAEEWNQRVRQRAQVSILFWELVAVGGYNFCSEAIFLSTTLCATFLLASSSGGVNSEEQLL